MDHDLVLDVLTSVAIFLSLLALWLNYRTARGQRLADSPLLTLSWGPHEHAVTIRNQGRSPALGLGARTSRGGFIRWSDQFNEALRRQSNSGELVGGDEPWTADCSGETRSLEPQEHVVLVLAEALDESEVLELSYRDYTGRRAVSRFPLS